MRTWAQASCTGPFGYHDSRRELDVVQGSPRAVDDHRLSQVLAWPDKCDDCPYLFTDTDRRLLYRVPLWRTENGRMVLLCDAPPGSFFHDTETDRWVSADPMSRTRNDKLRLALRLCKNQAIPSNH